MTTGPGLELARAFYTEVVAGLVAGIPHAAALIGEGSEVLGFDTERSTDHSWGPRLTLFVDPPDVAAVGETIDRGLPDEFRGWAVRYPNWRTGTVTHHVEVTTIPDWFASHLGYDPRRSMNTSRWLSTPQQLLLSATAGAVFRDDSGELSAVRRSLGWFPDDVWLWIMACQWRLIADAEEFVGRCAEVEDDLGARVQGARQIERLMRMCLLQERRYAPYAKWLGTAFAQTDASADLADPFRRALEATDHRDREAALAESYETVAEHHNRLQVTWPVDTSVRPFEVGIDDAVRPYMALGAQRLASACVGSITDHVLAGLPLIGSIDQLDATTDLVANFTDLPGRLGAVYDELMAGSSAGGAVTTAD